MSSPKQVIVKESISELKALLKKSRGLISPRVRMLIEIKKNEQIGISKRELAEMIGVNHNSVQTWRGLYIKGGIKLLCSHNKTGFRPSVINKEEHIAINNLLKNPNNGLRGYNELMLYLEKEFNKTIKYNTLLKYCIKNFKSSVKVARKSHVKKNIDAVNTFKKTSL